MDVSPVSTLPVTTPSRPIASVSSDLAASTVPAPPPADATAGGDPTPAKLAQAINQVNDAFQQKGQELYASFEKDKATGIDVVKIVDKKTHETVRQMPIKEMLTFAQSIEQQHTAPGKLVNATV